MNETGHQAAVTAGSQARVLVVDDNSLNRMKMRRAVENLGHVVDVAEDGAKALEMLRAKPYDAVLLDIVMPEVDGFEVLDHLKRDQVLWDIPVIVISSLDDETESVVRALELGAEDFLPKSFDPVLLKARLGASLTKKRYRDKEREYFRRIDRLTKAAEVLESGRFNPDSLDLEDIARGNDPLGHLANVFRGMAAEIYQRELKLKRTIQTLQGSFLAIAVGLVWGLTPALSRMAFRFGANPLGLAVWVNAIAAVFCLGIAAWRRRLPRLSRSDFFFYLGWAGIAGILERMVTFVATAHVEAAMLSLIVTLQGFMVFSFSAITGLERASPRRLLGLLVGLVGVGAVLLTRFHLAHAAQSGWLLFAVLLPLLFAVEALFLDSKRPVHVDIFASVGIMMALSTLMLLPIAYWTGHLMAVNPHIGQLEVLIFLMGIVGASSLLLAFHLIATAGAVFYSQSAYTMTIAGVVWGMLLLNEQLSPLAWLAFAIIVIGMYLVEPRAREDELLIHRPFTKL